MLIRRVVRYTGTVQGVGFRATARTIARRHPVTGLVRNEPDGSVHLEAQGEADAVDAYLADLRATVRRLVRTEQAHDAPVQTSEQSFEVSR